MIIPVKGRSNHLLMAAGWQTAGKRHCTAVDFKHSQSDDWDVKHFAALNNLHYFAAALLTGALYY